MRNTLEYFLCQEKWPIQKNPNAVDVSSITQRYSDNHKHHLSISPGKWNQREQRAIGRNDDSQLINNRLGKIRFEIERQYFDSIGTIEVLTAHQIVSKCWREPDTERGVLQLFVKHNDLFAQSVGVSKCASTYNK